MSGCLQTSLTASIYLLPLLLLNYRLDAAQESILARAGGGGRGRRNWNEKNVLIANPFFHNVWSFGASSSD